jgi:glycosyltransferase involved in cell wall biosynthesis
MNILIASDTFYPKKDGVVTFLEKVIPKLSKNFNITLLVPGFSKKKRKIKGCTIIELDVSKKIKICGYKSVKISLKSRKKIIEAVKCSDIIWSQDLALIGALSIYYGKRYGRPVINYIHQIFWEQAVDVLNIGNNIKKTLSFMIKSGVRYLYNLCDILMIPYKDLEKELKRKGIATKTKTITLGVDNERFKPAKDKNKAKKEINIDPKYKVIGYCGRLSKEKDLSTLKSAFIELKKKTKDVKLLIVGSGEEKKIFKGQKDIIMTGSVKDPEKYYKAMDIFVMPSLTETTSLATLEAMASGLTVISTKVGFIKSYIKDKENGLFYPKKNSYVLEKKLEKTLKDNSLRQDLGDSARLTITKKFNWENTTSKIIKVLKDMPIY